MSARRPLRRIAGLAALSVAVAGSPAWAATRALIVGIDDYAHVQPLRGAVADARDVQASLRRIGATDIRTLLNADAQRRTVLSAFEQLAATAGRDDTIFVVLAGHGAQEPERTPGSEPDGKDEVFLLQPFDPKDPDGASEKILDKEFNHYVKKMEATGARVIFVADTCSGGGLARGVDPRGEADLVYRSVTYTPIKDHLVSVAEGTDAFGSAADFRQSLFLAAVDKQSRVPELKIPGVGYRGGLSYAFARALEGAADLNGDGMITADELFAYVRQIAHELSNQRQKVVLVAPEQENPKKYVVAEATRGIAVRPPGAPAPSKGGLTILPADDDAPNGAAPPGQSPAPAPPVTNASVSVPAAPLPAPPAYGAGSGPPIRLASLDGQSNWFASLPANQAVAIVAPNAGPDLVWDPRTRDVLAGPDVIARNIDPADLAGVVEHLRVLDWLKQRSLRGAQPIVLLPSDEVHNKGTRVEINVGDLAGRYLVLFNVSGNGAVQMLYPLGSDPPQRAEPGYSVEFQVQEPFGADHIVAVTSGKRLADLEKLLRQSARRLNADRLAETFNRPDAQAAKVGYVGLYTSP